MTNVTSVAEDWESPTGVPLDAILFGGRRATNVPLVVEARDWNHGVFMGATISSEQTAAAEGIVGQLRRDPFAMLPFCGYNMADYFSHWLSFADRLSNPPQIFQVNWFRKGADGKFLWPGFAENSRVIEWVTNRLISAAIGQETPIGLIPAKGELNLKGIEVSESDLAQLFEVNEQAWLLELESMGEFFNSFGAKLPTQLREELEDIQDRIIGSLQATWRVGAQ